MENKLQIGQVVDITGPAGFRVGLEVVGIELPEKRGELEEGIGGNQDLITGTKMAKMSNGAEQDKLYKVQIKL